MVLPLVQASSIVRRERVKGEIGVCKCELPKLSVFVISLFCCTVRSRVRRMGEGERVIYVEGALDGLGESAAGEVDGESGGGMDVHR